MVLGNVQSIDFRRSTERCLSKLIAVIYRSCLSTSPIFLQSTRLNQKDLLLSTHHTYSALDGNIMQQLVIITQNSWIDDQFISTAQPRQQRFNCSIPLVCVVTWRWLGVIVSVVSALVGGFIKVVCFG